MEYVFEFSSEDITTAKKQNAFRYVKVLSKYAGNDKHVVIRERTTHIGNKAFYRHEEIESIQ